MAKGQKEAVVEEVINQLPNFKKYSDNAILLLTSTQLESIKDNITFAILSGIIEYSKDVTNHAEVRTYARSMVMNHLKKAKELNGGHAYIANPNSSDPASPKIVRVKATPLAPKGVNPELLTEELKEFVKTLV